MSVHLSCRNSCVQAQAGGFVKSIPTVRHHPRDSSWRLLHHGRPRAQSSSSTVVPDFTSSSSRCNFYSTRPTSTLLLCRQFSASTSRPVVVGQATKKASEQESDRITKANTTSRNGAPRGALPLFLCSIGCGMFLKKNFLDDVENAEDAVPRYFYS
ncbi:unnamed protein product [Amoebophrya sp. A120]|nr:unnamed protein product [Amoebophrya sp. A120]|eukprot:GSA120T00011908001.1